MLRVELHPVTLEGKSPVVDGEKCCWLAHGEMEVVLVQGAAWVVLLPIPQMHVEPVLHRLDIFVGVGPGAEDGQREVMSCPVRPLEEAFSRRAVYDSALPPFLVGVDHPVEVQTEGRQRICPLFRKRLSLCWLSVEASFPSIGRLRRDNIWRRVHRGRQGSLHGRVPLSMQ